MLTTERATLQLLCRPTGAARFQQRPYAADSHRLFALFFRFEFSPALGLITSSPLFILLTRASLRFHLGRLKRSIILTYSDCMPLTVPFIHYILQRLLRDIIGHCAAPPFCVPPPAFCHFCRMISRAVAAYMADGKRCDRFISVCAPTVLFSAFAARRHSAIAARGFIDAAPLFRQIMDQPLSTPMISESSGMRDICWNATRGV